MFDGKNVIITGAAGVLGSWIARAFADQGANLFLIDKREDKLLELTEELPRHTEVLSHPVDLSNVVSTNEITELVQEKWGAPDILVNNAGIYPSDRLYELPVEKWSYLLAVNLTAPFILTQSMARLMVEHRKKGSIVNISSGAAISTWAGAGHYSTSKAGLEMLTRAFALELAPFSVRVNAVRPGFAPGSSSNPLSEEYVEAMKATIPMGRTSGPTDVSEAIMFLCSERASYITGTVLTVDGGRSAGVNTLPQM